MGHGTKKPNEARHPDMCKNPATGVDAMIAAQREREKKLHMRRVSRTTWIVVPEEKDNDEYARRYAGDKLGIKITNGPR